MFSMLSRSYHSSQLTYSLLQTPETLCTPFCQLVTTARDTCRRGWEGGQMVIPNSIITKSSRLMWLGPSFYNTKRNFLDVVYFLIIQTRSLNYVKKCEQLWLPVWDISCINWQQILGFYSSSKIVSAVQYELTILSFSNSMYGLNLNQGDFVPLRSRTRRPLTISWRFHTTKIIYITENINQTFKTVTSTSKLKQWRIQDLTLGGNQVIFRVIWPYFY